MPVCEGRPGEKCPDDRNDSTVRHTQGDLFLCRACEEFRFPTPPNQAAGTTTKKSSAAASAVTGKRKEGTVTSRLETGRRTASTSSASDQPSTGAATNAAAAAAATTSVSHIVNELLTYVAYYRNRANSDSLRRVVLSHYTADDVTEAKRTIADIFRSTLVGSVLLTDRRNSTVRSAHEAELDDVISIFDLLDEQHLLDTVVFVAADLERLPKYGPEEVNICSIVHNHQKLSANVDRLSAELEVLKSNDVASSHSVNNTAAAAIDSALVSFQQRIDQFHASVNTRIDHLHSICTQFNQSIVTNTAAVHSNTADNVDRSSNLIVFGIAENRNASVWKDKLDNVFHFIVGKDICVADAFRMGSYREGKVRPLMVKLSSAWDRRLILASCRRLKDYNERVFVRPDEPIEMRRKKTLDSLKWKAERDNKVVIVNDGVLSVDGVAVYSLRSGNMQSNHE